MVDDTLTRVFEMWRREGVELNPGASAWKLEELEEVLGSPLPPDVVRFYSTANGMRDPAHDSKMVSFWSIDRILAERDVAPAGRFANALAFADVMIDSWFFRFGSLEQVPLAIVADGSPVEHGSLTEFFKHYLDSPDSLNLFDVRFRA